MAKREEWIRQAKRVIHKSPKTKIPGFKPEIYLIGIEPRSSVNLSPQEAEDYVCELEQKGVPFNQLNIRVVMLFIQISTNRVMVKHADIKEGKLSDYFWPAHKDYGNTPIIYDEGCKRPVKLP